MGQAAENLSNYQVIYEDCSCVKENIIFCDKCNNSRKFAVFTEEYDKDIVSICDKCNGCGKIKSSTGVEWCDDCGGKGYLDWLERVIKPKKKVDIHSGISGYTGSSGYPGVSGVSGCSGYPGLSGYSGYSGTSSYSEQYSLTDDSKIVEPPDFDKDTSNSFYKIMKWIKDRIKYEV